MPSPDPDGRAHPRRGDAQMRFVTQNIDGVELPEPVQVEIRCDENLHIKVLRPSDGSEYDFYDDDTYDLLYGESEDSKKTPYASVILKEVFHDL